MSRASKLFSSNWEFTPTIVVYYKSKAGIEFSNKYYFFHKISTDLKPDSYLFYQHKWSTKKEPVCVFLHFCWIIIGSSATFLWEFAAERKKLTLKKVKCRMECWDGKWRQRGIQIIMDVNKRDLKSHTHCKIEYYKETHIEEFWIFKNKEFSVIQKKTQAFVIWFCSVCCSSLFSFFFLSLPNW